MFNYFNYEDLKEKIKGHEYQKMDPFPHIVIDNSANQAELLFVEDQFPKPSDLKWWAYDNALEKKLAFDRVHELPKVLKEILCELNSSPFIEFLESLTGISGLIPDPHFAGGGLHQIQSGGKLDLHCDFNWHKRMELHRRINVILYLNKHWEESYGGHLELWDKDMTACHNKILPIFNRMVIFNTTDFSPHGHPDPTKSPKDVTRKSLALYYYSATRPKEEISPSHSTLYKRRPQDPKDAEIDKLRELRAKGRVENKIT